MDITAGLLDTCVVIELGGDLLGPDDLPEQQWISSVTLGELSVGPLAAATPDERAQRQLRLQVVEATFAQSILPYDADAARTFGRVVADVLAAGRTSRTRTSDLQIAAIAITHDLPLHTINIDDFRGIKDLKVVPVQLGVQHPPEGRGHGQASRQSVRGRTAGRPENAHDR
jgi:hypothetical protein